MGGRMWASGCWEGASASAEAADRAEDPEVARRERLTALFYALGEHCAQHAWPVPPDGLVYVQLAPWSLKRDQVDKCACACGSDSHATPLVRCFCTFPFNIASRAVIQASSAEQPSMFSAAQIRTWAARWTSASSATPCAASARRWTGVPWVRAGSLRGLSGRLCSVRGGMGLGEDWAKCCMVVKQSMLACSGWNRPGLAAFVKSPALARTCCWCRESAGRAGHPWPHLPGAVPHHCRGASSSSLLPSCSSICSTTAALEPRWCCNLVPVSNLLPNSPGARWSVSRCARDPGVQASGVLGWGAGGEVAAGNMAAEPHAPRQAPQAPGQPALVTSRSARSSSATW